MKKLESGGAARVAAAAGLGLTLALGAAPVVALAEDRAAGTSTAATAAATESEELPNQVSDESVQAVVVSADGTTRIPYEDAKEAAKQLKDNETLVLQKDYEAEWGLKITARDVVIDLNGHNVTSTKESSSISYGYAINIDQKYSGARDNTVIIKNSSTVPVVLTSSVYQLVMSSGDSHYNLTVSIEGSISCASSNANAVGGVSFDTGSLLVDSPSARALVKNGGFKSEAADGTGYLSGSLSVAFDYDEDGVVTLINDYAGTDSLVNGSKSGTLDMAGHRFVTTAATAVNMNSSGTSLKITNGTIVNERAMPDDPEASPNDVPSGVTVYDASQDAEGNFNLELEDVAIEVKHAGFGIVTQGTNKKVDIKLSGVSIDLQNAGIGIYFPSAESALALEDTTITAGTGIGIKGGTVTIGEGVEIHAMGEKQIPTVAESSGINATGDAIYVEGNYTDRSIAVNVSGGTFTSANGEAVNMLFTDDRTESAPATVSVSGGTFSSPVDASYCAEGFKPVTTPNADGQYAVAQAKDVVKIGDQAYDSVEAALESLESSDNKTATLALQADVYEDVTIPNGYNVTLDLAGHTLTNVSGNTISNNGTLTVVDSAGGGVVDNVTHGKAAVFNAEGATADLNAGTFRRSCEAGSGPTVNGGNSYYTILNQGTMTLGADAVVESKLADGTYSSYSSVIANGWQGDGKPESEDARASLIIDGARVEGGLYVKNDRYGELEMKDGYVRGTAAGIFNYGEATISGGTVEAALEDRGAVWNYEEATYDKDAAPATLTVSGGTLNAGDDQFAIRVTNAGDDGAAIRSSITISGGQINGSIGAKGGEGTVLGADQFVITGGTYAENPVGLMDAADRSVVSINSDGTFTALGRDGKLPAGTYDVPEGAEKLTAEDFQPGLSISTDKDGNVVATRPYVPPVAAGDAVKVEQSEGGKVTVDPSRADEGDEVTVTVVPDEGQELRELKVTDSKGNVVEVKAGEKDDEFVFTMPDGAVTVSAAFGCDGGELCPTYGFEDVDQSDWYHDAVDWAVESGVLNGYGDGGELLGPLSTITRAEMAQVLWNQAGRPEAEADLSEFADVDPDAWYADPVAWCLSEGIFNGYGDTFGTERPISREEVATVLWRMSGSPETDADLLSFWDAARVSAYATDALSWATDSGVVTGKDSGTKLDPQGQCTRAEVAAMLMRMAG